MNDRPELASAIGRCIAIWAQADNEMGNLFGILLGTDSEAALEVFLTLRRAANQRDALKSAAKFKLSPEEFAVFNALLGVYGSLEKERNSLAHGCFGVAANDPTVLLWIDIRDHVHFQTDILTRRANGNAGPDPHKRLKESMFVYTASDLEALQSDMEQFWRIAQFFNSYLRESTERDAATKLVVFREFPLLKAALSQVSTK